MTKNIVEKVWKARHNTQTRVAKDGMINVGHSNARGKHGMKKNQTHTSPMRKQRKSPNKVVLGVAMMAATALVGVTGVANAQSARDPNAANPTSKAACKSGGWKKFGFKNQGDCVSWFNQNGTGYGGNNNNHVNANVNVQVNGSNNVINIVINFLFGN